MGCRGTAVVGAVPHGDGNRLVLDVAAVQRSAQVNRVGGAVLAADPDQLGHDCDRAVGASNNKVRNGSNLALFAMSARLVRSAIAKRARFDPLRTLLLLAPTARSQS